MIDGCQNRRLIRTNETIGESNMLQPHCCSVPILSIEYEGEIARRERRQAVAAITAIDLGLAEVPGGRLGLNGASATRHFSFLDKPLTRDSWLPFGVVRMAIPILSQRRLLLRLPPPTASAGGLCHGRAAVHGNVVVVV